MAAVFGRTEISLKKTGVSTTIPDSPVAKLMYYFDCVCSCVEPDSNATTRRLRAYKNYSDLSNEEQAKLLLLCVGGLGRRCSGGLTRRCRGGLGRRCGGGLGRRCGGGLTLRCRGGLGRRCGGELLR